jgi:heterokaryon incompatibility protein (HET)
MGTLPAYKFNSSHEFDPAEVGMFPDPAICWTCQIRLTKKDTVPIDLQRIDVRCPLCSILSKIVIDALRSYGDETSYTTEPLQDSKENQLPGPGPAGGDDLLLRLWRKTHDFREGTFRRASHDSMVWIKQLPIQKHGEPPDPGIIQYHEFRCLINDCIRDHSTCSASQNTIDFPVLRVIDCQSRRLVHPGNEPYLTLSYVWGQHQASQTDPPSHIHFPPTIEDAMSVTLALGYKNLWVDRYCIKQEDKTEVLQQISVMDTIYRNSALTIIAACGKDPQYGLPGVGSRLRHPYHKSQSSRLYMREVLNRENLITFSHWNKRAWTLQEALFARRKLVFTDYEVYYECSEHRAWESNPVSFSTQHVLIPLTPQRLLRYGRGIHRLQSSQDLAYISTEKLSKSYKSTLSDALLTNLMSCLLYLAFSTRWSRMSLGFDTAGESQYSKISSTTICMGIGYL